jgi:DNA polymerase I-like protein with 3'-5' exonuclease and polymerase domains
MSFQQSLFADELTKWTPAIELPRIPDGEISIDLECWDPGIDHYGPGWCFPNGGEIIGIAISTDLWSDYFPIAHQGTLAPFSPEATFNWLRDELKNPKIDVIGHNYGGYDAGWLRRNNIRQAGKIIDTSIAAPLIDENRNSYSLDALCNDYCGFGKEKGQWPEVRRALNLPKNTSHSKIVTRLREMPAQYSAEYAIGDAIAAKKLWNIQKILIEKENLHQIFDLETRLIPVLLDMKERGVRVDVKAAEQLNITFQKQLDEMNQEMKRIAGMEVQIWAQESIAKAFDKVGIEYKQSGFITKLGKPSFTGKWLEEHKHELPKLIVKARRLEKAQGTFLQGHILSHLVNGKIHANFNALRRSNEEGEHRGGAVTGRFSSSNPNLQNLPSDRSDPEMAVIIRSLFLPWEGDQWGAIDYSGQEPRTMVHFCYVAGIKTVLPMWNAFHENPTMKFHKLGAKLTGLRERVAKDVTLATMYGAGGAKLCKAFLGLPTKFIESRTEPGKMIEIAGTEGQKIMDEYHKALPFVKEINQLCTRKAEKRGWIRSLLGRIRHFQREGYSQGAFPYKALNVLCQSSCADMMKQAMVDLHEQLGVVPLVTVHDELGLSCSNHDLAKQYREIMLNAVKLSIPMHADAELGNSWGQSGSKDKIVL